MNSREVGKSMGNAVWLHHFNEITKKSDEDTKRLVEVYNHEPE